MSARNALLALLKAEAADDDVALALVAVGHRIDRLHMPWWVTITIARVAAARP